ncbi:Ddt domain-containing protein ptm [Thalictrum thalictroides]|uniref:Ddt domain-containing protein ptm n=1 Tax=Thalictrum thalictroides TaxID=46969 RepID=A0A7J6WDK5_THATH|nr:Ddt domain-containing protein ptm [Thalictrum thalictroides]
MEFEEVKLDDRARKRRKREKIENVGRYVKKEFEGYGIFIGKVVSHNDGLYRVDYEDGDFEDLELHEVAEILVNENDFDEDYQSRKTQLNDLIRKNKLDESNSKSEANTVNNGLGRSEASSVSELISELECGSAKDLELDTNDEMDTELEGVENTFVDGDADSSTDSCESVQNQASSSDNEAPLIPPPELPSSSGNIGVPEESVSHLLSVYSFLRSFSIQLFLSPFRLDDFVGSLNCGSSNTLMDAVHFSLLRSLRRHLEMLSSDGAKLASKCLRRLDWNLLDALTWPAYLVEYLVVMGYAKGPEWKEFYTVVLDGEYCSLSVTKKLMVMQILCDDVMESAELRAEVDLRESTEEEGIINGIENPLTSLNGPRRVHPKYSKTSAFKDTEAIHANPNNTKSSQGTNLGSKAQELDEDGADVDQDENSDECQLCGMDGTLICCDGCPSAYHARCIGLNKMLIPDGLWFCPECTAKKVEPTLRISAGLRGAEIFGIDPYEQIFLGICGHLLVLTLSIRSGPSSRYYKEADIPKVVKTFFLTEQHKSFYSQICMGIMQYWGITEDSIISFSEGTDADKSIAIGTKEDTEVSVPMYNPDKLSNANEGENCTSNVNIINLENEMLSGQETDFQMVNQDRQNVSQRNEAFGAVKLSPHRDTMSCEQLGTESLVSSGSVTHCPDHSDLTQQNCPERSSALEITTYAWGSNNDIDKKVVHSSTLPIRNDTPIMSFETGGNKGDGDGGGGGTNEGDKSVCYLYMGDSFKPQSYTNQYFLGDIATSAAANFSVLASEGKGVSEAHASSNTRKIVSANVALQLKAFSSASIRFIWPNSEKKAMEVPRERCGWCISCKAPTTSKKGCLLNLAASNAIKTSARNIIGLRPIKNGEGNILGIATYILHMAESLRGFLNGRFLSLSYRKQWRKDVEEASTCSALKFSLLELEEHIRPVAFSGDWIKLVDDWMVESSAVQNASVGAPLKRPGGRRSRKQAAIEVPIDPCDDDKRIVNWWRGGKLSKLVFQKGILPCSIVKKAARQGGRKKISSIYYAEGSEIPKRSRRFAWRAAVEMTKNAPQLALQVRYLDLHLRWNDMVRSEQNSADGKVTEAETAFRNALICDKKIHENKIRYGLVFNQKHLPSRIMKNTIDVEQNEAGEERYWLSETHVPLFLIKDYEQKVEKDTSPPAKTSHVLSKLQRKQLKAYRRNIFWYLMHKEEKVDKCPCASCQEDLLLRDAVKCIGCEGYCHKVCTSYCTVDMKDVECEVTCNQCSRVKATALNDNINKTPVGQGFRQGQEYKMVVASSKNSWINGGFQPLVSMGSTDAHSLMKSTIPGPKLGRKTKRSAVSKGIVWKKKNSEESGTDFRLSNILLRGNGDIDPSKKPECCLCLKPYNPDLMYICCEECQLWYHADAVNIKESQIFDVLGFKCCKCRQNRLSTCPYEDLESGRSRARNLKKRNMVMEPGSEPISKSLLEMEFTIQAPSEKMEEIVEDDDPLLFSLESVVPITEIRPDFDAEWDADGASFQGPQKLPVRRHVKQEIHPTNQKLPVRRHFNIEDDPDGSFIPPYEESTPFEANAFMSSQNASPPQAEWELPDNVKNPQAEWELPDNVKNEMFEYDGVNFEDIYFSYNELLATDDNQSGLCDGSTVMGGDWVNSSGFAPPYNLHEQQYEMGTRNNHGEGKIEVNEEPAVHVPCRVCSLMEPAPDLLCEVCKIWIHNHCSPWEAESTRGDSWRCGGCRDWA